MTRTVHLHGRLGRRFGRKHQLAVDSPQEAVRALAFQLPGFRQHVQEGHYVVAVGRDVRLTNDQMALRLGAGKPIHITPAAPMAGIETVLLAITLAVTAVSTVMMLSMPRAPKASAREEATKTASFIIDRPENVTEQGHPVPLVYGRFRVGSVVGSAGIETTDVSQASVNTNPYGLGYGTPYGGFIGSIPGFPGSPAGNEWILAKGGKGGSGTTRAAQEDPNSLQSQATAKVLDIIGEGEIVGLVNGLESVYFDDTPLKNPDGTFNFAGVAVEQRVGLPDQDFVPGFTQTENSIDVSTKVAILTGPVTRTISDTDVTVARVTIRVPQLYKQDTTNGDLKATQVAVKISVQADGGGYTDVHTMTFDGKTNSGYQRSLDVRLPAGTSRQVRVTRLTADSAVASLSNETFWDVLTEIVEAKLSYPDTALIGLTVDARQFGSSIPTRSYEVKGLIIEVPTNYDPVTRVYTGLWDGTFKRAWSDNPAWVYRDLIVNRRYGLGARVSVNTVDKWGLYAISQYNDGMVPAGDAARTVTLTRSGTTATVTSTAHGLSTNDYVRIAGAVQGAYNGDKLVTVTGPNSYTFQVSGSPATPATGTIAALRLEPRYRINCYIRNPAQAYDLLASIASVFRGWAYWGSGTVMAVQDSPEDPSVLVTPSNVIDGKISYGRVTPFERRRSVAVVYWNDPKDGYQLTPEIVENATLIRRFGRRAGEEVTAFGCTSRGQARRMGLWLLEDESPSSNTTSRYQVGDDHSFVEPGRIASLADPMFTTGRRGGRVQTAAANSLTMDAPYTLEAGQTYTLAVMMPDGTTSKRQVTNAPGTVTTLTLGGSAWGTPPNPGAVWTLESNTVVNRQFRVRVITTDDAPYEVQAVVHDQTKFARVEEGRNIATPNFLDVPFGELEPPGELQVTEFMLPDGNASIPCAQVSWKSSPDPRVTFYQAQFKPPAQNWQPFADSVDLARVVRGIQPGSWEFRVRALDSLGRKTGWVTKTVTLSGQVGSLPNVLGLTVQRNDQALQTMLLWAKPNDTRPLRAEVLYHPTGVFGSAISLGIVDTQEYVVAQPGTYWVRTAFIDARSASPPSVVVALSDLPRDGLNLIFAALAADSDGKSTIFYQPTAPTAEESEVNDRWVDTADGNREYRRVAGSGAVNLGGRPVILAGKPFVLCWTPADDSRIGNALISAAGAQATADRKVVTFTQETAPIAEDFGDLWYQPSTQILFRWDGGAWNNVASLGAPVGTNVGSQPAAAVAAATENFNGRNDRLATTIPTPAIATDGTALDHTANTDGSVDLSFEWTWGGSEPEIDGFLIYLRSSGSSSAYALGTSPTEELVIVMTAEKRAAFFYGVAADRYYTAGVQAYRVVDGDVAVGGRIFSARVQCAASGENPYRPAANVAFAGDITGSVAGVTAADISADHTKLTGVAPGATKNIVTRSPTAPSSPTDGDIWVDTSSTPHVIKTRVLGAWQTSATLNTGVLADMNTVATATIDNNSATSDWYIEDNTTFAFASAAKTLILTRSSIVKTTSGQLKVFVQVPFFAADAIDCYLFIEIWQSGAVVSSQSATFKIDANNATQYPVSLYGFFDGLAAGTYEARLYVQRYTANTLQTDGNFIRMNVMENRR